VQGHKILTFVLSFGLIAGIPQSTYASAKTFKNCTELNKVYPGGVAKPGATNKGGAIKKEPFIDAALYKANIKSDRDKDGIACER
jgi:hypothetical protein